MAERPSQPSPPTTATDDSPLTATNKSRRPQNLRAFLLEPLDTTHAYIALLICCFTSGMTDAAAFAAWQTFLDMQTGNTVFLALGASGQPPDSPDTWLKSLMSIVFFILGAFLFPRAMRLVGSVPVVRSPKGANGIGDDEGGGHSGGGSGGGGGGGGPTSRAALVGSFAAQALCMYIAAGLVQGGIIPVNSGTKTPASEYPGNPLLIEMVGIGFLAFQAAGQVVASRVLGFGEIPTTVLTSAYTDLMSDEGLFRFPNYKRDRRVGSAVLLLLGGIAGGWMSRSAGGMASVIWLAAGLKTLIAVGFVFGKPKKSAS